VSVRASQAALVLLVLAGCTSDTPPSTRVERLHGIPVLEGATRPSGTRLGNGFTVAPGSVLLGDVFPVGIGVNQGEADGWTAHLLVTGDPREVLRHYQQEATEAGLFLNPASFSVVPPTGQRQRVFCGEDAVEGYTCGAFAFARSGTRTRSFRLWLRRQARVAGVPPVPQSFATLAFSTAGGGPQPTEPLAEVELGPSPPPLPTGWPPLPGPGGWIPTTPGGYPGQPGGAVPAGEVSRIQVEAGSRVVAPALADIDCTGVGLRALLRIEGDARNVLSAYRRTFLRLEHGRADSGPVVGRRRDDGTEVLSVGALGGRAVYGLTAFVRRGRPTWALLQVCLGAS
jgi:hypothetical protein